MIISFTGHRPQKIGGYFPNPLQTKIRERIKERLVALSPEYIITGMALGVDQWAAEVAIELGIPFITAVPFQGQHSIWPPQSKEHYLSLLKSAKEVIIVSQGTYSATKMQKRNEWMVDHSDLIIAVWDGSFGGTRNCVKYAESKGKEIVRINPKELE